MNTCSQKAQFIVNNLQKKIQVNLFIQMAREKVRWTLSSMATKKFVGPHAIYPFGTNQRPPHPT